MSLPPIDKHVYSTSEVAALMGVCSQTVINLFEREPGTIILARPERLHKRRNRTIRIPRGVYERVIRRLSVRA